MKFNARFIHSVIGLIIILAVSTESHPKRTKDELSHYFKGRAGTFVLCDENSHQYFYYNKLRSSQRFLPASTFKIPNSLIGLESGLIADEDYVIKWDSVKRWNPEWNRDHSLAPQSSIQLFHIIWNWQEEWGRKSLKIF